MTLNDANDNIRALGLLTYPQGGAIDLPLDALTTAQALIMINPLLAMQLTGNPVIDQDLLSAVIQLPEVVQFADAIRLAMMADPTAITHWTAAMDAAYQVAINPALVATNAILNAVKPLTVTSGTKILGHAPTLVRPQEVIIDPSPSAGQTTGSHVAVNDTDTVFNDSIHSIELSNSGGRYVNVYFEDDSGNSLHPPVLLQPRGSFISIASIAGDVGQSFQQPINLNALPLADEQGSVKIYGPAIGNAGFSQIDDISRNVMPTILTAADRVVIPTLSIISGLAVNQDASTCVATYSKAIVLDRAKDVTVITQMTSFLQRGEMVKAAVFLAGDVVSFMKTPAGLELQLLALKSCGQDLLEQSNKKAIEAGISKIPFVGKIIDATIAVFDVINIGTDLADLALSNWFEAVPIRNFLDKNIQLSAQPDFGKSTAGFSVTCPSQTCGNVTWDFGDGSAAEMHLYDAFVIHDFVNDGVYPVTATFVDAEGATRFQIAQPITVDVTIVSAPEVVSVTPANGAIEVPVASQQIPIVFSKDMDAATLTGQSTLFPNSPENIYLTDIASPNTHLAGTAAYNQATKTATLALAAPLLENTTYTLTLQAGFIKSSDGLQLVESSGASPQTMTFQFATVDTLAPSIVSTLPVDAAAGVDKNLSIKAVFNEAMDPATINAQNFVLDATDSQGNVTSVLGAVSYDVATFTATFIPAAPLQQSGIDYTARVGSATDKAGNPCGLLCPGWSFITFPLGWSEVVQRGGGSSDAAVVALQEGGMQAASLWQANGSVFASFFDGNTEQWSAATSQFSAQITGSRSAVRYTGTDAITYVQCSGGQVSINQYTVSTASWGSTLAQVFANATFCDAIQLDKNGNIVVVFRQGIVYWASRYDASTMTWGTAFSLVPEADPNNDDNNGLSIAMDAVGNAIIGWSWFSSSAGKNILYARKFNGASKFWGVRKIVVSSGGGTSSPVIAMNNNGAAVMGWSGDFSEKNAKVSRTSSVNDVWGTVAIFGGTLNELNAASVGIDAASNIMLILKKDVFNNNQPISILAKRFDATSGIWGSDQDLGTLVSLNGLRAATAENGDTFVLYSHSTKLLGTRYDALTDSWGITFPLGSTAFRQEIAVDSQGNGIFSWPSGTATMSNNLLRYSK